MNYWSHSYKPKALVQGIELSLSRIQRTMDKPRNNAKFTKLDLLKLVAFKNMSSAEKLDLKDTCKNYSDSGLLSIYLAKPQVIDEMIARIKKDLEND